MKYRMPDTFIDMVTVASSSDIDLSRHRVALYDADEILSYVRGKFNESDYKLEDYNQVSTSYYNGPVEAYRVVKIDFEPIGGGAITLFGECFSTPKDYVIVKKSEYEEQMAKLEAFEKPAEENTEGEDEE